MIHILFLCVANSARSQMAEGLARSVFGANAQVWSAGSHPGALHPLATQAMKEIGLDISCQFSKSTADIPQEFIKKLQYVITLCDEEICPMFSSQAIKLHWPIKDPASSHGSEEEKLDRFRQARDLIKKHLIALHTEIGSMTTTV